MIRHPRYLEIPWQVHWDRNEGGPYHHGCSCSSSFSWRCSWSELVW